MNYEQAMEYIHAVQWAGHKPGLTRTRTPVSYTHLDVYKRQVLQYPFVFPCAGILWYVYFLPSS